MAADLRIDAAPWVHLESPIGRVAIDPALGNLRDLSYEVGDQKLSPLHTAPWTDSAEAEAALSLAPVERRLAGDFFCAPFGANDVDGGPPHGWTANSRWILEENNGGGARFRLERNVMGAVVEKSVQIAADAPLLYQTHIIRGGEGALSVAHHPMVHVGDGARLCVSPKAAVRTPDEPLEHDRHRLACGITNASIHSLPGASGDTIDLAELPIGSGHEDFVTLIEAPGRMLGWTAVVRETDIVFVLKEPKKLPVTMLWHSNRGRDYFPWNGRHFGVLGIEDGCASGSNGHRAACGDNTIRALGVPTTLLLSAETEHRIAHVIGAVPRPGGWQEVADIRIENSTLVLADREGRSLQLPFESDFFRAAI